ncbi:tetratricopeptide repeat protein [Anabaena sp. UHCC 0451]|uniref:tetratricopeptide repeat protein n=1 Tax=Anabaena sp. UHCC 0451 TaxID=2055235 RepID=UPI002B1F1952|nr:tetratricopeptide repeat protein [Anabaena sp. UHCC 0451]MEA5576542.1 tetratricopeptide repeat protein [Anabaena sp. UHCC 0451]
MNIDDALKFTQSLIENHTKKLLNDSQMTVLRGCLEGKSYREIYDLYKISEDYSKEIGSDLWKILSEVLGVKVTKNNLRNVIEQHLPSEKQKISDSKILPKCNDELRDFVGRDAAINDINDRINEGKKIIVIKAAGGVGKSTLAKQYLYQNFELVLPLEMAKDTENITAVESVVEEWLKQHFKEEPGREFGITLSRLKTQLQTRKVGVLIDNLEPALDERGRFVEKHKGYVRLLGILADSNVQSVTLVTSRERLCDDRVNGIYHYPLSMLDVTAWKEFFTSHKIEIDTPSLEAMYKVYGGNAKAMDILLGVIREDYKGDIAAYWQENSTLVETELKNLVKSQFKRLETLDTEAYKLLCRLGCFRYQDVPRVSIDALLALLWDVPQEKRRDVIKALKNRCLVEFEKGEYWLHPVVREQGIERLKGSGEWEEVNRKAAEFWTESVKSVETIEDAHKAFEAYYQFLEINDFDRSAGVIVKGRYNKWSESELLGRSFYRLNLLDKMIRSINWIINQVIDEYYLSRCYNILGDLYWLTGKIHKAIECHKSSGFIAINFVKSIDVKTKDIELSYSWETLRQSYFLNMGLCKIDLGDLEAAEIFFQKLKLASEIVDVKKNTVCAYVGLAFINSCLGFKEEALFFTKKAAIERKIKLGTWTTGYRLIFLGITYKNLENFTSSFEMYIRAIAYSEESNYTQVKAKALTGLAELYRIQDDFKKALSHHSESIELLDKIGAKYDLAEAYYQLGLTYQKMGEIENSNTNFNEGIRLFNEMEAPKQVEKVEKAKRGNID